MMTAGGNDLMIDGKQSSSLDPSQPTKEKTVAVVMSVKINLRLNAGSAFKLLSWSVYHRGG